MDDRVIRYITLGSPACAEVEEKKSVFIGHAAPISTEEEALAFIKDKKAEYSDARHNVYAYLLDHGTVARCSDDGEPQGTAGVVLLDVLKKNGVTNAVIVVTRYFGGILLGAGGLVRAYSAAAKAAVQAAGIVTVQQYTLFSIDCSYGEHPKLKKELSRLGASEERTVFGEGVTLYASIKREEYERVGALLSEFGGGRLSATEQGTVYRKADAAAD